MQPRKAITQDGVAWLPCLFVSTQLHLGQQASHWLGRAQPFYGNAMMIAVQSGSGLTGKWVEERRNVLEDYRRYFGTDPPSAGAIAIMTDTDNTGEEALAWYGPIRIVSAPDG
jgi:hypothetical protein